MIGCHGLYSTRGAVYTGGSCPCHCLLASSARLATGYGPVAGFLAGEAAGGLRALRHCLRASSGTPVGRLRAEYTPGVCSHGLSTTRATRVGRLADLLRSLRLARSQFASQL